MAIRAWGVFAIWCSSRHGHDQRAHCSNGFAGRAPADATHYASGRCHPCDHRGIGANVALKDAVRLCRVLQAVNCGEQTLLDALRTYETEMIDYGFRAARTSLYARQ